MSEEKLTTQIQNLEILNIAVQRKPQQGTCFTCEICGVMFPDMYLYREHFTHNLVVYCKVCTKKFCGSNKFSEHKVECERRNREQKINEVRVVPSINKDSNSTVTEDTKKMYRIYEGDSTDLGLPFRIMRQESVQRQSTNNSNAQFETEVCNFFYYFILRD